MHVPVKQRQSTVEDTTDLVLDDGSIIHFCFKFCYLGTVFTPDLSDLADVANRLNKANSAFGQLRPLMISSF